MSDYSEIDRLIAHAYPETVAPQEPTEEDPFIAADIAQQVHDFETHLHRPLHRDEHEQIVANTVRHYEEARDHADRVMGLLETDMQQQVPLLERDLGRKLLEHELAGIRDQAHVALQVRGEPLDAENAWSDYWRHHNTATGEEPPDTASRHDIDKHMAQRVRELNRQAEAAAADTTQHTAPVTEWAQETSATDHADNVRRQEARMYELAGRDVPARLQDYATHQPEDDGA